MWPLGPAPSAGLFSLRPGPAQIRPPDDLRLALRAHPAPPTPPRAVGGTHSWGFWSLILNRRDRGGASCPDTHPLPRRASWAPPTVSSLGGPKAQSREDIPLFQTKPRQLPSTSLQRTPGRAPPTPTTQGREEKAGGRGWSPRTGWGGSLGGEHMWELPAHGWKIGCRELGGSRKPARGSSHSHTYTLPANSLSSQIEHSGVSSNCHPMLTLHTFQHVCSHPLVGLLSFRAGGAQTQKLRQASPLPSPGSCCVSPPHPQTGSLLWMGMSPPAWTGSLLWVGDLPVLVSLCKL